MSDGEIPDLFGPPDPGQAAPRVEPAERAATPGAGSPPRASAARRPAPAPAELDLHLGSSEAVDESLEFDPTSGRGPEVDLGWDQEGLAALGLELEVTPPRVAGLEAASLSASPSEHPPAPVPAPSSIEQSPSERPSSQLPPSTRTALALLELGIPAAEPRPLSSRPEALPVDRAKQPPVTSALRAPAELPPSLASFGNLNMDLGAAGFDLDAELGGGAAMQLNVAVPLAAPEDGPWPTGQTPFLDDLAVDSDKVLETSGFGRRPGSVLGTPMYFVRASLGLGEVRKLVREREERLVEVERARDAILAELGESRRAELGSNDRFARLFAATDKYAEDIEQRTRVVEAADAEGAAVLADLELRLERARIERSVQQKRSQEMAVVRDRGRANVARARGAIRRVDIEVRNVVQRAEKLVGPGENMPPDLGARYLALGAERQAAEAELEAAEKAQPALERAYEFAEDEHRRAAAAALALEAQKQGILLAHEGDMKERVEELEEAREARQRAVADVGRALLALRGEIPVDRAIRLAIVSRDSAVEAAARELRLAVTARDSLDESAYATGRLVVIGGVMLVVALLLFAAL